MEKGKLIVFEGASDGIGKSTQIGLLRKRLESEGNTIVSHHFPTYNTYHGAPVEQYLALCYFLVKHLSSLCHP